MSTRDGLLRIGQVIDWLCISLASLVAVGILYALLFNKAGADVLMFFVIPIGLVLFGKAARYIINGFAS